MNASSNSQARPIHCAAQVGGEAILKKLVEYGAEINAQDSAGNAPLHYAATLGFLTCVVTLLKKGASAKVANKKKQTAADLTDDKDILAAIKKYG